MLLHTEAFTHRFARERGKSGPDQEALDKEGLVYSALLVEQLVIKHKMFLLSGTFRLCIWGCAWDFFGNLRQGVGFVITFHSALATSRYGSASDTFL